jgi:hypothetical protein
MRVQSDFSNSSGFLIRKSFGIAREEPLICGMWLHFQRHGFVFTENGLHWNLPTAISVPGNSENHFETGVFFIHGGEISGTTVALKLKDGSIYDWQRYKIAKKKPRPEFLILTQGGIERCVKLGHMDIDDAQKEATIDTNPSSSNNAFYRKNSSGLSGGAIAGIVIACVVVLAAASIAAIMLRKPTPPIDNTTVVGLKTVENV